MTDLRTTYIGSTAPRRGVRPGSKFAREKDLIPNSPAHAYQVGEQETLCHRPIDPGEDDPAWGSGLGARCEECKAEAATR